MTTKHVIGIVVAAGLIAAGLFMRTPSTRIASYDLSRVTGWNAATAEINALERDEGQPLAARDNEVRRLEAAKDSDAAKARGELQPKIDAYLKRRQGMLTERNAKLQAALTKVRTDRGFDLIVQADSARSELDVTDAVVAAYAPPVAPAGRPLPWAPFAAGLASCALLLGLAYLINAAVMKRRYRREAISDDPEKTPTERPLSRTTTPRPEWPQADLR